MKNLKRNLTLILSLVFIASSCSNDDDALAQSNDPDPVVIDTPFQELYDQGIDRYLGTFTPTSTSITAPGITEYFFEIPDGPICYTGNEFSMFTRDGSSNNLLIFLNGGGFCNPIACAAVEDGIPLVPFGILSPADPQSPTSNFNLGYVPYCDGSAMIGDVDVDSNGDGIDDRFFRGVQNLSASLDVIADRYPMPDKIVLAGNSAGGFAVHHALPLVRKLYPDVAIDVINDSGTGIINPSGWLMNLDYWNGGSFYPNSCTDCIGTDGNLTEYHKYQLLQDPNIRMAYISSKQDDTFAQLTQGGGAAFEEQLLAAANELKSEFPERFNSLIPNGTDHTFIIRDYIFEVSNTNVRSWISDMINNNNNWISVTE
ncbi:vtpJ-therm [Paucihalobacter ruber]|uniref:VtpJ-therm n=1 Tax=Paucihalobacter ruber TaxID=2567861 RepID=A0A506PM39_9FLAO|nr:pectin acetylesterase-family hydrolase [Paucihalobacter ruber]TPV33280.1 vtpJ-therm [Paucihalobacter ruber]